MGAASVLQNGSDGPARWSLRLLGDFQLGERATGEKVALPGKRERVLLAYLALSPGGRQPRRKLVTLLWGDAADDTTLDNLRTCIFNLRKALGDTDRRMVASEDRDIVLDVSVFDVDVLAVRRLGAAAAIAELEAAARLHGGDFLEGLSIESEEFESWRREEATRCKGQVLDALTKLMAQLAEAGETERAIEAGLRILRLEPLHETAVRRLMRLYAGSDRRATAAELYRTLADSLKKDLGAQPDAETRAVYADIARGLEGKTAAIAVQPPSLTTIEHSPPPAQHAVPGVTQNVNRHWVGWLMGGLTAAAAVTILLLVIPGLAPKPTGIIAATDTRAIALAVLPFANLSNEQEQEFFSDGLTDEIASALAKVRDLRIVARTSVFEFKGKNRNIRTIGEQLGVTHLIEGSVRKAGDRVRITVQLIRADDGTRIWSDDYDRQLTDIFVIQEEIARAISSSLHVPLGLKQGESLVSNRTGNLQSYEDYLRAKALLRSNRSRDAVPLLDRLLARDPGYAPAWALRAYLYEGLTFFTPAVRNGSVEEARRTASEWAPKQEMAAQRAIQLDPNLPDGYASLASLQVHRAKPLLAEDLYSKALALDPDDPTTLDLYANQLLGVGRLSEAVAVVQKVRLLEPFVPSFNQDDPPHFWLNGQDDAAIAALSGLPPERAPRSARLLAQIYAARGSYAEAADALLKIPAGTYLPGQVEEAARLLRTAPATVASPQNRPRLGDLGFVYLHVGAPDRYLEYLEERAQGGYWSPIDSAALWHPAHVAVRKTERFKAYALAAGLVDYWRAKGWPDFCRPIGADDFVCE